MAPRGRHKKTSRMDAAFDAMKPFGFPEKLVRSKMNQLLKEYGGDDGYPFIEAEAYKVLIDAILAGEDEESKQGEHSSKIFAEGETSMKDDLLKDEMVGDEAALATIVPSAQGDENSWKDIVLDQTAGSQDMRIVEAADINIGCEYNSPVGSPPQLLIGGSSAEQQTARKRKPCYGWIGDGEEDDNFVILTPAVAPV